jgi:small-conductance mechanosensitive channel
MSQSYKEKTQYYEKELKKREEDIRGLMEAVESERSSNKELEAERKRMIKLEISNESITERNNELTSRLEELEKVNHNLKEEICVFKSKLTEHDASSDKMNQYL